MAETITMPQTESEQPDVRSAIEVENPATRRDRSRAFRCMTPEDVAEVAARARRAQPGWEALGFEGRARILRRAARSGCSTTRSA